MASAKADNLPIISTCMRLHPHLNFDQIFISHKTHFLVECPSRAIDSYNVKPGDNGGALCIPYFGFNPNKFSWFYNGPDEFGHGVETLWNDDQQCLANNCVTLLSKQACEDDETVQPCVCYDSCPLGKTYFPMFDSWDYSELEDAAKINHMFSTIVEKPCSARGACRYDGTCVCHPGYVGDNCEHHKDSAEGIAILNT